MIEEDFLFVTDTVHTTLEVAANAARPLETGGILVGWREDRRVVVVDIIELASTDPSSSAYRLDPPAVNRTLQEYRAFSTDSRRGYVGSWHSHPALQPPSMRDRRTFITASRGNAHSLAYLVIATNGVRATTHPTVVLSGRTRPKAVPYPHIDRELSAHGEQ